MGKEARRLTYFCAIPWTLLVVGALLAHLRIVPPFGGFLVSLLSIPAGLLFVLAAIVPGIRGADIAHPWAMCAIAMMPFFFLLASGRDVFRHPQINDVATDLANPPTFEAIASLAENHGRDLTFPQSFAGEIRRAYPDVKTREWTGGEELADRIYDAVVEVADSERDWIVVEADPSARTLEAVAESTLFRFKDDVVVRITRRGDLVLLDMRSKSRMGRSDLGVNAKRIRAFLNAAVLRATPDENRPAG